MTDNEINHLKSLNPESKKIKKNVKHPEIESFVLEYVEKCNDMSFPITGVLLQEVALKYAETKNIIEFKASNGWLQKILKRYSIKLKKISGESRSADYIAAVEYVKNISKLLCNFDQEDIFNFDETVLYWKLFPDKTLASTDSKIKGVKKANEKVSILLGASLLEKKCHCL